MDKLFYTRDDAGSANDGVYEAVLSTGQGSTRIINEDKPCKTDTVQQLLNHRQYFCIWKLSVLFT